MPRAVGSALGRIGDGANERTVEPEGLCNSIREGITGKHLRPRNMIDPVLIIFYSTYYCQRNIIDQCRRGIEIFVSIEGFVLSQTCDDVLGKVRSFVHLSAIKKSCANDTMIDA